MRANEFVGDLDQRAGLAEAGGRMHQAPERRRAERVGGRTGRPPHELGAQPVHVVERHEAVFCEQQGGRSPDTGPGRQRLLPGIEQKSLAGQRGGKFGAFARQPLRDAGEHRADIVDHAGMEDIEGQRDQVGVKVGGTNRHHLALAGRADALGVDPVGVYRAVGPHHDDGLRGVKRPRDLSAELVAAAEPRVVPPDRAAAVFCLNGRGQRPRHLALLRGVTDKDIGHGRRLRWKETGTLHGKVVVEKRPVVVNLRAEPAARRRLKHRLRRRVNLRFGLRSMMWVRNEFEVQSVLPGHTVFLTGHREAGDVFRVLAVG
jgi:hypothetical protein